MKRLRTPAPYTAALLAFVLVACGVETLPSGPPPAPSTMDGAPVPDTTSAPPADTGSSAQPADTASGAPAAPLYRCATPALGSVSQVIGPKGGEINIGAHWLRIPSGALQQDVTITATVSASEYVRIRLEPHGLQFDKPAELTLSYEHCNTPPPRGRYVAYVDDLGNVLELLDVNFHRNGKEVSTRLEHFSGYAIAD